MSSVLIVMDQRSSQGSLPSFLEGRGGGGGEGTLGTRLATDTLYLHLCSTGTTASIELFSDRGGLVKNVEEKAEKKKVKLTMTFCSTLSALLALNVR